MNKTQNITASLLKEIVNKVDINIDSILNKCLAAAEAGEDRYSHYDSLNEKQHEELNKRGFHVKNLTDNRDGYLFIISW